MDTVYSVITPTNNTRIDSVKLFKKYILAETSSFLAETSRFLAETSTTNVLVETSMLLAETALFFLAETDLGRTVPTDLSATSDGV